MGYYYNDPILIFVSIIVIIMTILHSLFSTKHKNDVLFFIFVQLDMHNIMSYHTNITLTMYFLCPGTEPPRPETLAQAGH